MKRSKYQKTAIRWLAYMLIVTNTMLCAGSSNGWAMLAPLEVVSPPAASAAQRAVDIKTVQSALESKILIERLKNFGLTESEIKSRLSQLSDKEVHQLATQIHAVNPGGDGGVIVGLLVVAVLVLLIVFLVKRV